ncbi:hypothetical protein [Arcicella rigui]|uniref:Uncharacterized protein n=1 Tax=Arcicella rigui TaxID=797020 RepID=A0ABU5QC02_9BACT|nr:hypothetical protein [Arcicella rigui]MEA5140092.1 hypothetical protein [Arcicella rigui]
MKKLIVFSVLLSCLQVEAEASSISFSETSIKATNTEATYKTRRRKKKGFLWGLFRKKDCGCPKH